MYRSSTLAAWVAAATVAVTAGLQAPASAQLIEPDYPYVTTCPAGTGCVYVDADAGGSMGVIPFSGFGDGGCHALNATFNNRVSSAYAGYGSGERLELYDGAGCTGTKVTVANHWFVSYSANASFNDKASSFKIVS